MIRLHIPKHFEKLGIMRILKQILEEYFNKYGVIENNDNFLEYNISSSIDPVKRFLEFLIEIPEDDKEAEIIKNSITYYSHLLLSFRGTLKIFDILNELENVIGFKIGSYKYSTQELEIDIETISIIDLELFKKYLLEFFNSLLYYRDIKSIVDEIILKIKVTSKSKITGGSSFINEYVI